MSVAYSTQRIAYPYYLLALLLFVLVGERQHELSASNFLTTALPFVVLWIIPGLLLDSFPSAAAVNPRTVFGAAISTWLIVAGVAAVVFAAWLAWQIFCWLVDLIRLVIHTVADLLDTATPVLLIIVIVAIAILVFPLGIYGPITALIGGWDDWAVEIFHKVAKMSGPSKFRLKIPPFRSASICSLTPAMLRVSASAWRFARTSGSPFRRAVFRP